MIAVVWGGVEWNGSRAPFALLADDGAKDLPKQEAVLYSGGQAPAPRKPPTASDDPESTEENNKTH